ncbi:voltage-dependent anion channel domain-containing protein [Trichoderma ceciliae]
MQARDASGQSGVAVPGQRHLPDSPLLCAHRPHQCRCQPDLDAPSAVEPGESPSRQSRSLAMAPSQRCALVGDGYESPTEDNQPPFFFGSTPTASGATTPARISLSAPTPGTASISFLAQAPRRSHLALHPPCRDAGPDTYQSSGSQPNLDSVILDREKHVLPRRVGLRDRIACYQWTFFTMTMATGGVASAIHGLVYKAEWVTGFGIFFCLFNILLFLTNCVLLSMRFYLRPGSLTKSFTDQVESLFIPAFFVSIAVILTNICQFGVPHCGVWLLKTLQILFWIYTALSAIASAGLYLILWSTLIFPIHMMTPTWVFPAYPLMLTAPFAGNLIAAASSTGRINVLCAPSIALSAVATQGTGCLISLMISAAFIYRLMTQKLPRDFQRPGVFISIGPYAFTAGSIAQLGSQADAILPPNFLGTENSVDIIKIVSILVALWFWGLSMWFFLVSVGSLWKYLWTRRGMPFQMTWWSFVFPNTALVTATEIMGSVFENRGLQLFGCAMTIALIIVWTCIFLTMITCIKQRKLLWPKSKS